MTGGGFSPPLFASSRSLPGSRDAAATDCRRHEVAGVSFRRQGSRLRRFFKKQGWTDFAALSRSSCLTLPFGGRRKAPKARPERYPATHVGKPSPGPPARAASICGGGAGDCKGSFLMTARRPQAWRHGLFSGGQAWRRTLGAGVECRFWRRSRPCGCG